MLSPATSPWSQRRPDFRYLCEVVSLINRQINLVFVRFLVSSIFALPFLAATLERHRKSFFCQACGRWANERMNIWLTLWSLNRPFPWLSTEQCFILRPIKLISRWQLKRFFVLLTRIVNRHFTWIRLFFPGIDDQSHMSRPSAYNIRSIVGDVMTETFSTTKPHWDAEFIAIRLSAFDNLKHLRNSFHRVVFTRQDPTKRRNNRSRESKTELMIVERWEVGRWTGADQSLLIINCNMNQIANNS